MSNLKINGKVYFAGLNSDNKNQFQVLIEIDTKKVAKLSEVIENFDSYDFVPVKTGNEENPKTKGKIFFRATSIYDVEVYDENGEVTDDIDLATLGAGSDVTLFVNIKETTYKRKTGLVAYLSKIKVNDYIERVPYNPFEDSTDEI